MLSIIMIYGEMICESSWVVIGDKMDILDGYLPGDDEADLAFCLSLDNDGAAWMVFCLIGRIPQSIGATSPHFIWVLQFKLSMGNSTLLRPKTNLKPQSSHSRTGFHPNLFAQISHFVISRPLEKNKSSGFQPASTVLIGDALPTSCSFLVLGVVGRFAPGLIRVKRCTIGIERMVEPPPVAAAVETIEEWVV